MSRPGIEPWSPGREMKTLTAKPMDLLTYLYIYIYIYIYKEREIETQRKDQR